jgi:hypothetical protein
MDNVPLLNNIFKDRTGVLKEIFPHPLRAIDIKEVVENKNNVGILFQENTPTLESVNIPIIMFNKKNFQFRYNNQLKSIKNAVLIENNPYYFICLNEQEYKALSDQKENSSEINISRLPSKIISGFDNNYYEFYFKENKTEIYEVSANQFLLKKENLTPKHKIYKNLFFNNNGIEVFVDYYLQNCFKTNTSITSDLFTGYFEKDSIKQAICVDDKIYVLLNNGNLYLGYKKNIKSNYWDLIDANILFINTKNKENSFETECVRGVDLRDNRLVVFNSLVSTGIRKNKKCRFLAKNFTFGFFGENFNGIQHGFEYKNGRIEGWQYNKYYVNNEPTTLCKDGNGVWSGKQYINGLEV